MVSCGEGPGLGLCVVWTVQGRHHELSMIRSSVNIPWPERGMGDADYILAFQKIVMPIAMEFAPELVISA